MPAKSPEECDELFGRFLNAGDVEGVVSLYEPDGSLILEAGIARGTAEIRAAIMTFAAMHPKISMNVVRVIRTGDDLAAVYNDWTLTGKGPDGSPIQDSGKAIEIVRRQRDGSWAFAIDDPRARG